MAGIGNIGSLGTDQLRALNRLAELGRAISQNQKRLTTLRRINSAADDPSGLVSARLLETELKAAEIASQSVTRASAILNTADAAAGEIVSQLQNARALVVAAAGGLSADELAGNQIQLDQVIDAVDRLAQTEFGGRRLLDGTAGFSTTGVNNSQILDVDVVDKSTAADVTVSINVTQQATQRTDQYTDGKLIEDVTLIVQGPAGTTTIELKDNDNTQAIADAFNSATYLTGISATRIDANTVDFTTVDYGSNAAISIEATSGAFATATTQAATDAVATVDGAEYTADGTTFNINTSALSVVVELDPSASGALTSFTVSGSGLEFEIGSSIGNKARVGLGNLHSSSLGGITGKLSSLRSGGSNTLTSGNATQALQILDDALADVIRTQAVIGGFERFTLDSASRLLGKQIENTSSALSAVRDTDVALESALLTRNQLLEQTTLQALSISNLRNQDILSLLQTASNRY